MKRLPTRYHLILHVDGQPRQVHTFDMAYGDPGWYKTITSLGAFGTREGKRLMKVWHEANFGASLHRRVTVEYDYEQRCKWNTSYAGFYGQLEHHHHSSLWSLYLAIGYDYKKQRYIA